MIYRPAELRKKTIVAIDFETANRNPDSACAVGLVRIENGQIVKSDTFLIRPESSHFVFTYIHGIEWKDVSSSPSFGELWPRFLSFIEGADLLAAHSSVFDERVLKVCCKKNNIIRPKQSFICTVKLARKTWKLFPTKLPDVCEFLDIELKHHDPMSDANACAEIILAAQKKRHR
ncbi:MAG: 3'-5' exonuclease [Leptospirales bacterium]